MKTKISLGDGCTTFRNDIPSGSNGATSRASPFIKRKQATPKRSLVACHIVPDYRTFIDDYLKILDYIDWLMVAYPEKAKFLTENSV